jgi:hypothetical protein
MSFERHARHFSAAERCKKTDPLRAPRSFCCTLKLCKRLFQQAGTFIGTSIGCPLNVGFQGMFIEYSSSLIETKKSGKSGFPAKNEYTWP